MKTQLHKDLILLFLFWIRFQVRFGDEDGTPKLCHPRFKISVSFQKKKTELDSTVDQKLNIIPHLHLFWLIQFQVTTLLNFILCNTFLAVSITSRQTLLFANGDPTAQLLHQINP